MAVESDFTATLDPVLPVAIEKACFGVERAARILGRVARLVDVLKERPGGPEIKVANILSDHVKVGLGMY